MKVADLREARALKVTEMRAMLAKAEQEKRSLTDAEKAAFDNLKDEVRTLEGDEQRAAFMQDMERRQAGDPVGDKPAAQLEQRVSLLRVLQAAMEGRALTGAEAEYAAEAERRTGRKAQGVFVPASLFEKRATLTTTTPELIGTDHRADQFIAPFRDALLARRLGVRVLSGLHGNVSIPKYGTGLSVGWVAENTAVPESNMDMDSITLSPKHAGGVTELSRQLIQQASPDVEQLVRSDFAHMLAKAIDSALIKGGGANEPKGVLSTVGIQTANLATLNWANVSTMIGKLESVNANVASSAWLVSPTAAGALRTTLKSASAGAAYLLENGRMGELPVYVTNQVPNTGGATPKNIAILGDWSEVILGIWSEVDILVNPYAETPYKKGNVLVRAMSTVDIGVRHPEAFVAAQDLA
ncbi:MAG TPA: phage major capsid protein [Rhodocyclaceae bacterium]|nr:phage major capsid protein [Rhodocyclaceae bacterium]